MPGARILLVEDDEVLRDLMARNLQVRGHEVQVADNAQSALATLRVTPVDLVLLDINLPDETGWEVLRIAKKHGWLHQQALGGPTQCFPVVVLSAVRINPRRLAEFHPLAYLPKPFPIEAVLRLAAEAADRRNGSHVTEQKHEDDAYSAVVDEEDMYA
ncbi:MAG TPA: response regulator [Ktedonobacteraceae bacterium]|nr:response regulator [Ktedonobacteraceae bacterium]